MTVRIRIPTFIGVPLSIQLYSYREDIRGYRFLALLNNRR